MRQRPVLALSSFGRLVRRYAGPSAERDPSAAASDLEQHIGELRFALRRQTERTERLESLTAQLTAVLGPNEGVPGVREGGMADEPAVALEGIVTLVTRAQLPSARVLAASVRRHHPDVRVEAVLVGRVDREDDRGDLMITEIEAALDLDAEDLLVHHPLDELIAMLVPRLLSARIAGGAGPIVHLPAATWQLDTLNPLIAALARSPVVLVPRLVGELPHDGLEPTSHQLDTAGRIHPHLVAVDASPAARAFLGWWRDRLDTVMGSPADTAGHNPADRHEVYRELALSPLRPDVVAMPVPAALLSQWNLDGNAISDVGGRLLLNGASPVMLLDLTGFDPDRPFRLGPHSSRVRISDRPTLARLLELYGAELRDAGWRDVAHRRDQGRALPNGIVFDADLHALLEIAETTGAAIGDPWEPGGVERFMEWLRAPAVRGGAQGINRYLLFRVIRHRRDVALAFPDLDGADGPRLIEWLHRQGGDELAIPRALMAEQPVSQQPTPSSPRPAEAAGEAPQPTSATTVITVRVSGYLDHVLGLGAAARGYAAALEAAGVPVSTASDSLARLQPPVQLAAGYGHYAFTATATRGDHAFELICVNPGELPAFLDRIGSASFTGRRIGVWGWETNTIPPNWGPAMGLVDEVWVYSNFVATNLAAITDVPVVALPPPVIPPDPSGAPLRLGVPDAFLFLFIFDYSSTNARKNPVGLVNAFRQAFGPGEGPQLLIKTLNAPLLPLAEEEVLWAARGRPDIHVIDRSLSVAERDALIATCDCYVSLHRSEGFGLTLAEAMALGKPVIATGYSGNTDFMTPDNSYLVDHALTHVGPDAFIYPADGVWAEPDVDHAARLMRAVYDDPAAAAVTGARARRDIEANLSLRATGAQMRRRLERLAALPSRR